MPRVSKGRSRAARAPEAGPSIPDSLGWHAAPSIAESIRATVDEGISYANWLVDRAREHPELSVHEYRKTVRRLRSIVRLLRALIGPTAYHSLETGLRSAVLPTSGLRDARVRLAALERVPAAAGSRKLRAALAESWLARREELEAGDEEARVLETSRTPLARLPSELRAALPAEIDGSRLATAVERSYRKVRRLFRRAVRSGDPGTIHAARKRTKELRYQLEWLVAVSGPRTGKRAKRLGKLAQALGEVTDLLILERTVLEIREEERGLHPRRFARRLHRLALGRLEEVVVEHGDLFEESVREFGRGIAAGAADAAPAKS